MSKPLGISERLLSIATEIRSGEGIPTWGLIGNAFLLLYSHYLLKVVRETLILSHGSALDKSFATALSALTVGMIVFIYTMFYKKFQDHSRRHLLTLIVNGFFLCNIVVFLVMIAIDIKTPTIFYIWESIYAVLVVSQFWSYCADLLNPDTGRRLFPPIMVGATLGAWLGPMSAEWVYGQSGIFSVLLAAIFCLALATWLSALVENWFPLESKNVSPQKSDITPDYTVTEGFRVVLSKPYLLLIAIFVILMNWINTTGEFIFASYVKEAAAVFANSDAAFDQGYFITHYYSIYYTWINFIGFILQTFLVARLFRWIGIRNSILILPVVMISGYGLLALVPLFAIARYSMIVENSTSYSIANTTRNALYLPLPRNEKYLGKTTIDTFCWRLGDLIQFVVILAGTSLLGWQKGEFVWLNLILSIVMLVISYRIAQSYRTLQKHNSNT